jgi:hypothetical protein
MIVLVYPFVAAVITPWVNQILGIAPEKPPTGGQPPTGFVYSGNLKVNLNCYSVYDDSAITPTNIVFKLYHADGSTLFGTRVGAGSDYITGQVLDSDRGTLYLAIDHAATTIAYVDDVKTDAATGYLTAMAPKDIDQDGILEHYFKVDLSSLTPLQAGETQKEITFSIYMLNADVTGLGISAITNPSSADLSGTSFIDLYATDYITGVTQGTGFKIVRVELTTPNAGNNSYVDNGQVKNVWVSIQGDSQTVYKWTSPSWQSSASRFLVWEATDVTQEVYGNKILYDRNMGSTDVGKITVHIQGANWAQGAVWNPTVKITYINPAGTIGTISLAITFTDT